MNGEQELADLVRSGQVRDPVFRSDSLPDGVYRVLLELDRPPALSLKTRLYYRARPFIPLKIRWRLQQASRPRALPPDWFITTALMDAYRQAGVDCESVISQGIWPEGRRFAVVLTHDVETTRGLAMIDQVVGIEESLGFRSSWNFVPQAYRVDKSVLSGLEQKGFEVGVHGLNHDGRLYSSRREFARRRMEISSTLKEWNATGFRSPQVHRNLRWLQDLEIEYDSSCFDVDPLQPMPGGCGSIWPFEVGRFVEIPYTLPQDHVLYFVLKEKTNDIWKRKTEWLIEHSGMVCLITHPDYLAQPGMMDLYRDFLEYLRALSGAWNVLPGELARYWRQREVKDVRPNPCPSPTEIQ